MTSVRIGHDWRVGALVGVALTFALLLFQIGEVTVSDGASMLAVTVALLHHGSFAVSPALGTVGRAGRYYSKYGIGLSLVALPLVALGDVAGAVIGHQAQLESLGASTTMPIIAGLLAIVLWHIAVALGASKRWAVIVALGALVGTYALPYGKDFFSGPLTALGIAIAIDRLLADRYRTAGMGLALAVITRPETVVLVPLMSLVVWRFRGMRAAIEFGAVAALGAAVDAAYDWARFGNVFSSGYKGEGFTTPFLHGATGLLFGTNKSLFVFAPIVLLLALGAAKLWRTNRFYVSLAATNFVGFFVLAALWHSWQGGWSWGPRLLLPGVLCAMPLLAGLASKLELRAAIVLLIVGFAVSASTLLVPTETQQFDRPMAVNGPSVVRQYRLIPSVIGYSASHLHAADRTGGGSRYLGLWQVNLGRELGDKGLLIGVVGSLMLLAALIATMLRLRAALDDAPPPGRRVTATESRAARALALDPR